MSKALGRGETKAIDFMRGKIKKFVRVSHSPDQTHRLAARVARILVRGDCLALAGDFGAGKTTFVQGLAAGLGFKKKGYVSSPSFVILKNYEGRLEIYHFDVYRLRGEEDLADIGFPELSSSGVAVIEWADKVKGLVPKNALWVRAQSKGGRTRVFTFKTFDRRMERCLSEALG